MDDPPSSIGPVVAAWTNHRDGGPIAAPWSVRLLDIGLWTGAGFGLALIGFFAVGGWLEVHGTEIRAEWFLDAVGGGALLGALVGVVRATRRPRILTLFVGERGCVQIERSGPTASHHALLFEDVEGFRTKVDVAHARGIPISNRLVYVKKRGGDEALWYLSRTPHDAGDPQSQFVDCVLRAFARAKLVPPDRATTRG